VAIIAGAGRFPFEVAREGKRQGCRVIVLGIRGWADGGLARQADVYEEIAVGELGRLIERLKAHEVRQVIMAGKVTKDILLRGQQDFDAEARGIVQRAADASVNRLLGEIAALLAREGITLLDSSTFLREALCPTGAVTARGPTSDEAADISVGFRAARQLASLDIGQTVVVKHRVVVAVEALEGTDAAIQRAHALAGSGLVVVKAASPSQDHRFDLPVVGLETVDTLVQHGVCCLAVQAHTTLLLDRNALIERANASNLCLVGVEPPAGS
jgi:DUF1009 family protein